MMISATATAWEGGAGGGVLDRTYVLDLMHGRSRMTIDCGREGGKMSAKVLLIKTGIGWGCQGEAPFGLNLAVYGYATKFGFII